MTKSQTVLGIALATAILGVTSTVPVHAQKYEFKLTSFVPAKSGFWNQYIGRFINAVSLMTNGEVKIKGYSVGVLAGPFDGAQAVQKGNIVFLSGQIPLNPETMDLVEGIEQQIHQVFKNLLEVIKASDSSTDDLVKLNIYLIDLSNFALVNDIMSQYFSEPYPARATVEVSGLPLGVNVEIEAIVLING